MNSRERVFQRLEDKTTDRAPNLNIIMAFAAAYINVPYSKFVTDYRYLAEANLKCCSRFGIDMLSAISDPMREASGFGAPIVFPEDGVPYSDGFLVKSYGDLSKLKVSSPFSSERMLDRIKAVELFRQEAGSEYPILGWIEGAFAEANDLRGMTELMTDLYDEPEFVRELMEICTQQAIAFAEEQIRAGADFIGVGDAAASLVSPGIYEEFILPFEKAIINAIHKKGARAKLHICGNVTNLLHLLPLSGADLIDIDWMVDFRAASEAFQGRCSACGNFDPVKVLLYGTTEDVRQAVLKCISDGGRTSFIAAGCEVPRFTPHENMLAVSAAIAEAAQIG